MCSALEHLLPANRQLVTDGGHFCGFPASYLSVPEPSAFLFSLVFDDGAYGAELHFLRMLGLPEEESLFTTPDLVAVAESVGARGMLIETLDDLKGLAAECVDLRQPLVAHIPVNRDVRAGWLEEAFARKVGE